jgi:hypothetical protein
LFEYDIILHCFKFTCLLKYNMILYYLKNTCLFEYKMIFYCFKFTCLFKYNMILYCLKEHITCYHIVLKNTYRIGGVMVSVLDLSTVDCGFEPRLGQTKNYKIGICCFSTKHTSLRSKSKDLLARNQNNVSE